jgi:predicted transcriptional regulator of viral defense system
MARPKTHNSTADRISKRVRKAGPDTVFHAGQFLDLDTRTAVDKALSRLVASGFLRRLARGLYFQPKTHPVLGDILPPVEAVAKALADRDRVRLQPFGGYAANLLRLSDQVPARVVFLTDGKPRKVHYGNQTIELRRASPRMMAAAGTTTGLVIAGLRYVGKANITTERVAHLRTLLSAKDRHHLVEDISLAPAWMHPYFRAIAGEADTP